MSFWKHLNKSTVSKIRKGKEVRKDMVAAKAWPALIQGWGVGGSYTSHPYDQTAGLGTPISARSGSG